MLAEERLSRIMKLLSQQRTATVQELCEALDASESTIRRDLNELDRMGKVNKVHGGATLPDSQFLADEPTMAAKEALACRPEKVHRKGGGGPHHRRGFRLSGRRQHHAGAGPGAERPGAGRPVRHQRRRSRPSAGPEELQGLSGGRSAAARDGGHHRRCGSPQPAAVQLHESVPGGKRRGAGRRIHDPRPRGSGCQGRGRAPGERSLVPRG